MDFTKMQGAANDFVMVDARNIKRNWSKLAITVCNRHLGIGCDSLIILLNSDKADFGMRTFDGDGSEAETCGNGIRCLARYVLEKGIAEINGMLSYKVKVAGTELSLNLVSMGNPHAVHFSNEPVADFPMAKIGPLVENLAVFPNRVNFEGARVLDRNTVEARVWERGGGETLACGCGACAITVASKLLGYTESKEN